MKELETELKYQGRTLKQAKREGRVALYELSGAGGALYGYEVIIVKVLPAKTMPSGRYYPEREGYPSNEDWGRLAWSYSRNDSASALEQYHGLCAEQRNGVLPLPILSDLVLTKG